MLIATLEFQISLLFSLETPFPSNDMEHSKIKGTSVKLGVTDILEFAIFRHEIWPLAQKLHIYMYSLSIPHGQNEA